MNLEGVTILHVKLLHCQYDAQHNDRLCVRIEWIHGLVTTSTKEWAPTHSIWAICRLNARTVEQEANRGRTLALAITESIHEFLQGSGALDLEEHLVVVVRNLDVEVLGLGLFGLLSSWGIGGRHDAGLR